MAAITFVKICSSTHLPSSSLLTFCMLFELEPLAVFYLEPKPLPQKPDSNFENRITSKTATRPGPILWNKCKSCCQILSRTVSGLFQTRLPLQKASTPIGITLIEPVRTSFFAKALLGAVALPNEIGAGIRVSRYPIRAEEAAQVEDPTRRCRHVL